MAALLSHTELREAAEADLEVFIALVAPHLALADMHRDVIRWWQSSARKDNILVLLPRGHLKSKILALKTVWELTKDPADTILYVSATIALAEKQLYMMKKVMESDIYRRYWPEMIHPEETRREKWSATEIAVDHPKRALEGIRDPSIKAAGLKTNVTGFHATKVKFDDIVVPGNAYTEDGRQMVANFVSQIASIKEPESKTDCVGTRYHGRDQYQTFLNQTYKIYDDDTLEELEEVFIWDSYMKVVEENGVFLWPRTRRDDGKVFGFNATILSKIKGEYEDRTQFFAQYYNNPNDPSNVKIGRDKFQYYERSHLKNIDGRWFIHGQPLAIFAGLDFAFSLNRKADSTALVVIGIDPYHKFYLLDIAKFKTQKIKAYYDAIFDTHSKWGYSKLRAEITTAQEVIVRDLKDNYIVPGGLNLMIDEYRPSRHEGSKEERVAATLEPKYDNLQIWHYKSGDITELEDELMSAKPLHDDIKDALTAAIDIAVAPRRLRNQEAVKSNVVFHSRFGGTAFR